MTLYQTQSSTVHQEHPATSLLYAARSAALQADGCVEPAEVEPRVVRAYRGGMMLNSGT